MGDGRMMVKGQPDAGRVGRQDEPEIFTRIIHITFQGSPDDFVPPLGRSNHRRNCSLALPGWADVCWPTPFDKVRAGSPSLIHGDLAVSFLF